MNTDYQKIPAKQNPNVQLMILPGHFVTSHSHVTTYMEITNMKTRCNEASGLATLLAQRYSIDTPVDTIVCIDGTEVIGTYLAEVLMRSGFLAYNAHRTIYVISPELTASGQIIFRDNMVGALKNKHVLLLLGSITTGNSVDSIARSVSYYGAKISGICSIFSAIDELNDVPIVSAFRLDDIPEYGSYKPTECPLCAQGIKIDAIVNSFGYSELN